MQDDDFILVDREGVNVVVTPTDNVVSTSVKEKSVVTVEQSNSVVSDKTEIHVVSVAGVGPVGPQGPAGAGGAVDDAVVSTETTYSSEHIHTLIDSVIADRTYVHNQEVPSTVWVIDHNLGKFPCVMVVDSAGSEVEGEVSVMTLYQVVLTFAAGFSGKAFLN